MAENTESGVRLSYSGAEIDRRLKQGTFDDAVAAGYVGTKADFDNSLANIGVVDIQNISTYLQKIKDGSLTATEASELATILGSGKKVVSITEGSVVNTKSVGELDVDINPNGNCDINIMISDIKNQKTEVYKTTKTGDSAVNVYDEYLTNKFKELSASILSLATASTSSDISTAIGGVDGFNSLIKDIQNGVSLVAGSSASQVGYAILSQGTSSDLLALAFIKDSVYTTIRIQDTVAETVHTFSVQREESRIGEAEFSYSLDPDILTLTAKSDATAINAVLDKMGGFDSLIAKIQKGYTFVLNQTKSGEGTSSDVSLPVIEAFQTSMTTSESTTSHSIRFSILDVESSDMSLYKEIVIISANNELKCNINHKLTQGIVNLYNLFQLQETATSEQILTALDDAASDWKDTQHLRYIVADASNSVVNNIHAWKGTNVDGEESYKFTQISFYDQDTHILTYEVSKKRTEGTWYLKIYQNTTVTNGVNTVDTLAALPIGRSLIWADVAAASDISLEANAPEGVEYVVIVKNTSAATITQPLPSTGQWTSMSGTSIDIPAGGVINLSIITTGKRDFVENEGDARVTTSKQTFSIAALIQS